MIEQEKIYINGTLKALKISTNNIYRLAKVFNKDRNTIQKTISDDTISEITVIESIENIEKDNHNENDVQMEKPIRNLFVNHRIVALLRLCNFTCNNSAKLQIQKQKLF